MSDYQYTVAEEIANSVTHGIAAILSIAGLAVMVGYAVHCGACPVTITSVSIFGASMFILYTASTLYHAIPIRRVKGILRLMDHAAIFLLIAGSYTPFCLVTLGGTEGLLICIAEWTIAVVGIVFQRQLIRRSEWLNVALYVAMGWMVVLAIDTLLAELPTAGLVYLVMGGLSYTFGVIFYLWDRLPFNHAIWHVFVFLGTFLQFLSVLLYVIPPAN